MIRAARPGSAPRRSGPGLHWWHISLGCSLVAAAAGWSAVSVGATPGQTDDDAIAEIYRRDCAVCHGADGEGTPQGPDLAGSGSALVDYMLRTGRMPIDEPDEDLSRHDPAYDEATTSALLDYVVGLQDGAVGDGPPIPDVNPARGDVAVGGEVWRQDCAACHAWSGTGGAMLNRSAPSVYEATPLELGEAVRAGPEQMPRFGPDVLTSHELDSLAAFVDGELQQAEDSGGWSLGHFGPVAEGAIAVVVGLGLLVVVTRLIGGGEEYR